MRTNIGRAMLAVAFLLMPACDRGRVPPRIEQRALVETLRIGSESAGPAYLFTEIRQVVATDSELYVLPAEAPEIRVFDRHGKPARTIGRRGAGPGEFDDVTAIGLRGDTLWTIDPHLRRITRFALNGALLSTARFEPMSPELGSSRIFFFLYPMALFADGSLVGFGGSTGRAIAAGQVTATPLLRVDATGSVADTIAWVPIGNEHMILRTPRSTMYRVQPFADSPLTAYSPSAGRVYVVRRDAAKQKGDAQVTIAAIDVEGDTAWAVTLPYRPVRLEAHVADSVRAHLTRVLAPRFPASEIDRALFVPTLRSPVADVLAGEDGSLWIGWASKEPERRFTVLDRTGRVALEALAPAGTRLLWAGATAAWGQVLDADGVPTLVRFALDPLTSPIRSTPPPPAATPDSS